MRKVGENMREVRHVYKNIRKEEKYINHMLEKGYILNRIDSLKLYFFEKSEGRLNVCKLLLVDENDYAYIEKVCNYVDANGLKKVDVLDKKQKVVRIYIYAKNKVELCGLPSNDKYILKEYKRNVKIKKCMLVYAMLFVAIFISINKWIAIAEGVIAVLCMIEVERSEKKIKMMRQ